MFKKSSICLVLILFGSGINHGTARMATDVLHYDVTLEPDISAKSVKGSVLIRVSTTSTAVEFDCGALTIDKVSEAKAPLQFSVNNHKLRVSLRPGIREIQIDFHGTPKYGIRFFPDRQQVYTVFSTSQWMVCIDDPADKATLTFKLILPAGLTPIANGELVSQRELPNNKRVSNGDSEHLFQPTSSVLQPAPFTSSKRNEETSSCNTSRP